MSHQTEEIKSKIDIVDFVGSYITLKKAGRNFKANCPFHQEKSPSFVVSPDRQMWHCFGSCHEGGDIIKFYMKWENATFAEALKELAERAGVKLETTEVQDQAQKSRNRLMGINQLTAQYYRYILTTHQAGAHAKKYLEERGVSDKVSENFGIGYAPQSWDSLTQFLTKKGYTDRELEESGVVIRNSRGGIHDRFRARLIFPIYDTRGTVIGFSGRLLVPDEHAAKYINTPETPLYHKRETLYGLYQTREHIKKEGAAILVEGEFDVITPFQAGIPNIVAVKGSAITREQLQLLKRYCNRIIFALDGDSSGEDAIKRGAREAEDMDFEIVVAVMDGAKDPDEAVRTNLAGFKKSIKAAVPIYDFMIATLTRHQLIDDPFGKKKIVDEMVGYLLRIQNPIIQSHYVKKIATMLEISEDSIVKAMGAARRRTTARRVVHVAAPTEPKAEDRAEMVQKYLLSEMFQATDLEPVQAAYEIIQGDEFTIPSYGQLYSLLKSFVQQHGVGNLSEFPRTLSPELLAVYDEIYLFGSFHESQGIHSIDKLAREVRIYAIKRDISRLTSQEAGLTDEEQSKLVDLTHALKEVEKTRRNI